MNCESVSRRLRICMTDAGWTLDETAEQLGISTAKLKGWLYGGRDMGLDGACLVCDVFDKSIDELVRCENRQLAGQTNGRAGVKIARQRMRKLLEYAAAVGVLIASIAAMFIVGGIAVFLVYSLCRVIDAAFGLMAGTASEAVSWAFIIAQVIFIVGLIVFCVVGTIKDVRESLFEKFHKSDSAD